MPWKITLNTNIDFILAQAFYFTIAFFVVFFITFMHRR